MDLRVGDPARFNESTRLTSILWRIDNTAALAHIRKEGGLRGRALLEGSERILLLAHQRKLRILPTFIPSEENVQADAVSRFQLVQDWHLAPTVFLQISSLWGPPEIDLFASHQSAQTLRFMSWRAADSPEAIDALEVGLFACLSVPSHSPLQEGYAEAGVVQGDVSSRHPNLERLFLVVWKILGGFGELTPSRTGPSGLFWQDRSDPQKTAMKELGSPLRPSSALPPFLSIKRL
jgi:hypothetical protein